MVLFIWDTRIAKLTETENRRVVAKVRQAWDMGLSAAALQCLHLDTPLLEQQNAKKNYETENNFMHVQLGQILDPKRHKETKNKKTKNNPPATSEELRTKTGCWELK